LTITLSGNGTPWGSAWQISASSLRDANLRMAVTAHNVANGNTDNFTPSRVESAALANGGVSSGLRLGEKPKLPDGPSSFPIPSQTDYATEGLNLILAKSAYKANAYALKSQSEASKTIIDQVG
jgi:flagellar basal body rod protein FlgC